MKFCWHRQEYVWLTERCIHQQHDRGRNWLRQWRWLWFAWTEIHQQINTIKKIYYVKENAEDEKFYFRCFIFLFDTTTSMSISVFVCVFMDMRADARIRWISVRGYMLVRTFCLWCECMRFNCDTHSEWKLFSVILEIKFSMNTCSLMYRQIRRRLRLGRLPFTPQQKQWLRCVCMSCVCMYCWKAFELCSAWQTHFI